MTVTISKQPNLFIVGGPKCGTTSLVKWLSSHPAVYFSKRKEPHYFNTDSKFRNVLKYEDYLSLYAAAAEKIEVLGDASVYYLYSHIAVQNIERAIGNPKYIVMLRNPMEMAKSLHAQQVFDANEDIESFEKAWNLQSARRAGMDIPDLCRDPSHLLYGEVCMLGAQLKRIYDQIPRNRVFVVILDELNARPCKVYEDILGFLNLSSDVPYPVFEKHNTATTRRSPRLRKIVRAVSMNRRRMGLSTSWGTGIFAYLDSINKKPLIHTKQSSEFRSALADYFTNDVVLLSDLAGVDLTHWLDDDM